MRGLREARVQPLDHLVVVVFVDEREGRVALAREQPHALPQLGVRLEEELDPRGSPARQPASRRAGGSQRGQRWSGRARPFCRRARHAAHARGGGTTPKAVAGKKSEAAARAAAAARTAPQWCLTLVARRKRPVTAGSRMQHRCHHTSSDARAC